MDAWVFLILEDGWMTEAWMDIGHPIQRLKRNHQKETQNPIFEGKNENWTITYSFAIRRLRGTRDRSDDATTVEANSDTGTGSHNSCIPRFGTLDPILTCNEFYMNFYLVSLNNILLFNLRKIILPNAKKIIFLQSISKILWNKIFIRYYLHGQIDESFFAGAKKRRWIHYPT